MLPSTKDVIGYLNRDIYMMELHAKAIERSCNKDVTTCGGCPEIKNLGEAIIAYKNVVNLLLLKKNTAEVEMET